MLYILYILLYITILNYIMFYRGRFIFLVAFSIKYVIINYGRGTKF
jgi:hypothetical protein